MMRSALLATAALLLVAAAPGPNTVQCAGPCIASDGTTQPSGANLSYVLCGLDACAAWIAGGGLPASTTLVPSLQTPVYQPVTTGATAATPTVIAVTHDSRGHTMVTYAATPATPVDIGIPNTRGNATVSWLNTSGAQAMASGTQLGAVVGSADVAALTVTMPPNPQTGDYAKINSNVNIGTLSTVGADGSATLDPLGNSASGYPVNAFGAQLFVYNGTNWVLVQRAAVAAPVYTPSPATSSTLGGVKIGANVVATSDGTISVAAPYTDALARVQANQAIAALNLNSAAYQPASAFDAAGLAAAEATRAQQAEALLAPKASPALTGAPTAPTAAAGTNTAQLATTAFVQAALPAYPWKPISKTTVSGTVPAISLLGIGLGGTATLTVPGVTVGDDVATVFAGTPPTGLIVSSSQVTAANTVQILLAATQALTASAQSASFNVYVAR